MHTIQLNIDDSIFDKFMGLLDILAQENKLEIASGKGHSDNTDENAKHKVELALSNVSSNKGFDINALLEKERLSHYRFYEEQSRIVYTYDTGTPMQKHDFERLITVLKDNNIKHSDIGLDVLMIEKIG